MFDITFNFCNFWCETRRMGETIKCSIKLWGQRNGKCDQDVGLGCKRNSAMHGIKEIGDCLEWKNNETHALNTDKHFSITFLLEIHVFKHFLWFNISISKPRAWCSHRQFLLFLQTFLVKYVIVNCYIYPYPISMVWSRSKLDCVLTICKKIEAVKRTLHKFGVYNWATQMGSKYGVVNFEHKKWELKSLVRLCH